MRGWTAILAVTVVLGTTCRPAQAQIGVFMASGAAGDAPTATTTVWLTATTEARAVAVSDIVTMSLNPLNATLALIAADGTRTPVPSGIQDPAVQLSTAGGTAGAALTGGTGMPPGFAVPGVGKSGSGGGGSGGGGGGGPNPLLSAAIGPNEIGFTARGPDGEVIGSGSIPVPDGGWWVIGLDPASNSLPIGGDPLKPDGSNPPGGGGNPAPDDDPPPEDDDDPSPGGGGNPPPTPVEAPEPATVVMALVGVLGVGVRRCVRR